MNRLLKALLVTILEVTGLTVWLVTYPSEPVLSTILVFLFLLPEHYIAIGIGKECKCETCPCGK